MYTLVQHSGFLAAHKPGFANAVESWGVHSKAEAGRVLASGGVLFPGYIEASEAEMVINYPPGTNGIYPLVEGSFGVRIDDGRPVYMVTAGDRRRLSAAGIASMTAVPK